MRIPEWEKSIQNLFNKIMAENFPKLEELNRYPGTGSTDRPKPVEPKETHINT